MGFYAKLFAFFVDKVDNNKILNRTVSVFDQEQNGASEINFSMLFFWSVAIMSYMSTHSLYFSNINTSICSSKHKSP